MKNQVLRYVAIVLLSFASLVAGWVLAVGVAVNPGGITFPDGTVQTTAAGNEANTYFLHEEEVELGSGTIGAPVSFPSTPDGYISVVEFVSVRCKTFSALPIAWASITARNGNPAQPPPYRFDFYIPMTIQEGQEIPGGYDIYVGTLATRIYHQDRVDVAGSREALSGYVMREDSTGTSTCSFALSGHRVAVST